MRAGPDPTPFRPIPADLAGPVCAECKHCDQRSDDHRYWRCRAIAPVEVYPAERNPITGEHFDARLSYTQCKDQNAKGDCELFEAKPRPAALVVLQTPEPVAPEPVAPATPERRSALRRLASRPAASIGAATTVGCLVALALLGPLGKVAVVVGAVATATATAVFSRLG